MLDSRCGSPFIFSERPHPFLRAIFGTELPPPFCPGSSTPSCFLFFLTLGSSSSGCTVSLFSPLKKLLNCASWCVRFRPKVVIRVILEGVKVATPPHFPPVLSLRSPGLIVQIPSRCSWYGEEGNRSRCDTQCHGCGQ